MARAQQYMFSVNGVTAASKIMTHHQHMSAREKLSARRNTGERRHRSGDAGANTLRGGRRMRLNAPT